MRQIPSVAPNAWAAFLAISLGVAPAQANDVVIPLEAVGFDMEIDLARNQLYVSLPSRNEIAVISLITGAVERRLRFASEVSGVAPLVVGTMPHGLDISLDGSTLYAALNGASSVASVDLDTMAIETIVIGAELGDARTWDVIEGRPDRVFASANPGSSGLSWITMIKRDLGDAASRVGSNRIIRAAPVFARSPDGSALYVGEGFNPNSLYKLDITTDAAPIVLEDVHGSVAGTDRLEVSPDGARIYLGSGQVLRTSDFVQIGQIGNGIPRLGSGGSLAYVAQASGVVDVYETQFFTQVDAIALPCSVAAIRDFELLNDGQAMLLLGDAQICGVGSVAPGGPVCEIDLDQSSYSIGESVTAQTFRLANPGSEPLPVELKVWFDVPGFDAYPHFRVGHDGSTVLPPGYDADFGPLFLFDLVPGYPLGSYGYGCRLLDPVTGKTLALDENPFEVQ